MGTEKKEPTGDGGSYLDLFDLDLSKFDVEEKTEPIEKGDEVKEVDLVIPPTVVEPEPPVIDDAPRVVTPTGDAVDLETLATGLAEEGVLLFKDDKDYDISSKEGWVEIINENRDHFKNAGREELLASIGDEGKEILSILSSGGSIDDYFARKNEIDFKTIPLVNSSGEPMTGNLIALIEDDLKNQGLDDEDIADKIESYKTAGLLEKEGALAKKKLVIHQEKTRKEQADLNVRKAKEVEETKVKEAEEFKTSVLNLKEVAGFKIPDSQAAKLYDFITVADKDGKTAFQKQDSFENRMLYAYFAMTGFDKEKLSKEVATKQAINFRKKLNNYQDGNAKPSSGGFAGRQNTDDQSKPTIYWNV